MHLISILVTIDSLFFGVKATFVQIRTIQLFSSKLVQRNIGVKMYMKHESNPLNPAESDTDDNNKVRTLLTFDEVMVIIEKDDSTKLQEVISVGLLPDINMKGQCLLSLDSEQDPPYHVTLLCVAFLRRSILCVKVLLDSGADIESMIDYDDLHGIEYECNSTTVKLVKHLVKYGVEALDDKAISYSFDSIYQQSYYYDDVKGDEIATELLPYITDFSYPGYNGRTFLNLVCSKGKLDLARGLLERGADRDAVDRHRHDALYYASEYGHIAVVKLLLDWDKSRPISLDRLNLALINAVVWGGQLEAARILTEYGANAHTDALLRSVTGDYLTVFPSIPMATFLLDYGADVLATDYEGYSALHRVLLHRVGGRDYLTHGSLSLSELLLERGADANEVIDKTGETVLLYCCRHGVELVAPLLQHGADANLAHAITGETPLMIVALAGRISTVKLLLEHGADMNQTNLAGQTVLDQLAAKGEGWECTEIAQLCMEHVDNKPVLK